MILFMVEADGSISNVSVNKGIGKGMWMMSCPGYKKYATGGTGQKKRKSVKVLVRMPIIFRIPVGNKKRGLRPSSFYS